MAVNDVSIANKALALIGANTITIFGGTSSEQIAATNLYEMMVEAALTQHRWRFATGQQQLNRDSDAPVDKWDASYQMPVDPPILLLNGVFVLDNPIKYDRYQNKIYNNAAAADIVVADYVFRAEEAEWPPFFTKAVVFDLAGAFAAAVTQDAAMAALFIELSMDEYRKAKFADSSSQTARHLNATSLLRKRLA